MGAGDLIEQPTPSDYIPAGGPVFGPLQLNVVRCLFTKVPFLLSDSAGKTAKLFGKLKLNIPQPLLGLFSPGNLYLKEAVSYSLTLLVNVCYSVFVSTTFLTHIYANS